MLVGGQIFFWVGYFTFFLLYEKNFMSWKNSFIQTSKFFFFNLFLVYIHLIWLLPLIIQKKQYFKYAILTFLLINTCVWLEFSLELYLYKHPARLKFIQSTPHMVYLYGMDVIILAISSPIKFALDYFKLQARQQEVANQQLIAEMKYLKLQINPHFLFNTLNSLYYLTQTKSNLAPEVVQKLAQLMRYMLEKGNEEKVLLSDEIAFIEAYLELEKIRIATCEISFKKPLDLPHQYIPPMLFIPLVENAFKHGVNKSSKHNYVHLALSLEEGHLLFEIRNQYLPDSIRSSIGIGISNLQKRLKLLYGDHFEFQRTVENDVYSTFMKFPIR